MPRKRKFPFASEVAKIVEGYDDLYCDGTVAVCRCCKERLLISRQRDCERHINTQIHKENKVRPFPHSEFLFELLWVLWSLNIPLTILDRPLFRQFWANYVPIYSLPKRWTLYRTYIPRISNDIEKKVIQCVRGRKIWVTVDECMDGAGQIIGNILVRTLQQDCVSQPFLLCSKRLPTTNAEEIAQIVIDTLAKFHIERENVVMLVTGGAEHMCLAGQYLSEQYKNLTHITCVIHGLHLVADEVRQQFPTADSFLDSIKKVFARAARHTKQFKDCFPGIPLPPNLMLTHWATWLKAVCYYTKHFEEIKQFVTSLNPLEAQHILHCQQLLQIETLRSELHTIDKQYSVIVDAIGDLEGSNLLLSDSLATVQRVWDHLLQFTDSVAQKVQEKFEKVIASNPGFLTISNISVRITSTTTSTLEQCLLYAPITSIDVERSFSIYRNIYTDRRQRLHEGTLEHMLMTTLYMLALGVSIEGS